MIYRFFIILLLLVAKATYTPLLAEDSNTQQRAQEHLKETKNLMAHPMPQTSPQSTSDDNSDKSLISEQKNEIRKNLRKLFNDNDKEINRLCSYVGFGILIAIFFMNEEFRKERKCLVIFSSFFAILSLFFNYLLCVYLLRTSTDILSNQNELASKYENMWIISNYLYWQTQIVLLIAVVLFCILGYQYFFDIGHKKKSKI